MRQSFLRRLRRFHTDRSGAVSVEFMVLIPVVIFLIIFVVWASLAITRASNVQEIAHDLARASLRYSTTTAPAQICGKLEDNELAQAITRSAEALEASRLTLECTLRANSPYLGQTTIEIELSYNALGDSLASFGKHFGLNLTRIERRAAMIF